MDEPDPLSQSDVGDLRASNEQSDVETTRLSGSHVERTVTDIISFGKKYRISYTVLCKFI